VDSSEDIYIYNIDFDNRDDNIAIKSGRDREARELNRPSRNIVIRNCRWKGHNAMAMGSEMSGGIYNVFAQDCSYRGEVRAGIYLKSNRDRGGEISNIHVQNFEFNDCNNVIFMNTNYKNEGKGHVPSFSDIYIEDLICNSAKGGIILKGTPEKPIRNVHLKNVTIDNAETPSNLINTENISFENVLVNGEFVEVPETE
jgi:polygalacturonase